MAALSSPLVIPENYYSKLTLRETEKAIKEIKDYFQEALAARLNLQRISAPLFVSQHSGLNDDLNGVERPVSFDMAEHPGDQFQIVHSLAKWKRQALGHYGFEPGEGLYTDMNAIRRDEDTDNIHSVYVDQWDWEKVITARERTLDYLYQTVRSIYAVIRTTELHFATRFAFDVLHLPEEITFVTSQELEDMYPDLTSSEREAAFVREKKAIFVSQIGGKLRSGNKHDGRAPDYDDWLLNGDIIVYNPVLDIAFELSSMGIRVDAAAMKRQLAESGCMNRSQLPFHKAVLNDQLPLTIGGGIGQSRLCMFFLRKAHIGEVQASIWPEGVREKCEKAGISLL
ncbi:MAG: aspartate--ammonia ligase [Ruminococcaceae bacterium]|nr:aspartate--ammonia ligase [Oscillospiraceae bacterium]